MKEVRGDAASNATESSSAAPKTETAEATSAQAPSVDLFSFDEATDATKPDEKKTEDAQTSDPFASTSDPFASGGDSVANSGGFGAADPFGASAATESKAEEPTNNDDPFKASADPFGAPSKPAKNDKPAKAAPAADDNPFGSGKCFLVYFVFLFLRSFWINLNLFVLFWFENFFGSI